MLRTVIQIVLALVVVGFATASNGMRGYLGQNVENHFALFIGLYAVIVAHLTISAMSLSFHRYHTHKGVILSKWVDMPMQVWLWLITSLNKVDWAAVHLYHHAYADQEKDPHSPVQKGIWHVFFLGVYDYNKGKSLPDVQKIKKTIHTNPLEAYIQHNPILGPTIMTVIMIILFGPFWGTVLSITNFLISPIFAIGGVNALAHWWGYRNHANPDNSRNIGFILPLNFIICGELDHNNHHAHVRSCSFRHRWFEFDIGYVYLKVLNWLGLAELKSIFNPATFKQEFSRRMSEFIESDQRIRKRCEELANELNMSYQECKAKLEARCRGEKVKLERSCRDFMNEVIRTLKDNQLSGINGTNRRVN